MPWSWRFGTVSGIPIYLHGTFLLLIAIVLISDWVRERSLVAAGAGVLFVLAIFGTVVLHEFGHALMARAVELVLAGSHHDFHVMEHDEIVGVLTRKALTAMLAKSGPATPIADVMDRHFETADAGEMLEPVFQRADARSASREGIVIPCPAQSALPARPGRTAGTPAITSTTPS
jgi:hypothetical protein